jgi:hypothetical protein
MVGAGDEIDFIVNACGLAGELAHDEPGDVERRFDRVAAFGACPRERPRHLRRHRGHHPLDAGA